MQLRRRRISAQQVELAVDRYRAGDSIAIIASQLDASYNNVGQRPTNTGVQLRQRGGSHPHPALPYV